MSSRIMAGSGVVERLIDARTTAPLIVEAEVIELREPRELRLRIFLAELLAKSRTLGRRLFPFSKSWVFSCTELLAIEDEGPLQDLRIDFRTELVLEAFVDEETFMPDVAPFSPGCVSGLML
jgi:hypothetical protein